MGTQIIKQNETCLIMAKTTYEVLGRDGTKTETKTIEKAYEEYRRRTKEERQKKRMPEKVM